MLNWVKPFSIFCLLDNNLYNGGHHSLEFILAAGSKRQLEAKAGNSLQNLQQFIDERSSWLFGHLAYDLKTEISQLTSSLSDYIQFPDLFFFEPEIMIRLNGNELIIDADNPEEVFSSLNNASSEFSPVSNSEVTIQNRISKEEYIDIIQRLQQHILRGDFYEINFCQEFFAENATINPVDVYRKLSTASPNPFSAFYRVNDKYLICASPERFLKKDGSQILSQPIKGTGKRVLTDPAQDEINKSNLSNSPKDRSENVMVVDLVRNDLSRICVEGSVTVDELYGVYPFPQVYQMISTVSGELAKEVSFSEIIRATFPMGSMTGAPKRNVMKMIERYEKTRRGIFSGALGYITPSGDFDLNVVIRSIMYNTSLAYLSFQAGSGITFYSQPESEWDECLLKADAIKRVLTD
ncbi:MAG: anthranilate synthase component I family protein [Bacteroidota bacterium]